MQKITAGDKVAIIAPCAQIGDINKISSALEYLKSLGLIPVLSKNLLNVNRYLAGTDTERAADLNAAFADSSIKAIFCARAAAGGTRILPYVDYKLARQNPKPIIGFCDNAAVQLALWQKSGVISFNGFGLSYDFKHQTLDSQIKSDLEKLLNNETFNVKSGEKLQSGTSEGRLLCSNLSTLLRMAGTPYFPDLSGKILLLEDTHEKIYRLDLMLQQLKQQPTFKHLKGIILGQFTDSQSDAEDGSIEECFADFLHDTALPAVKNFNFGHTPSRRVLPLGAQVQLNADNALLKILHY